MDFKLLSDATKTNEAFAAHPDIEIRGYAINGKKLFATAVAVHKPTGLTLVRRIFFNKKGVIKNTRQWTTSQPAAEFMAANGVPANAAKATNE
jgi:hypothetical protein